MNFLYNSIAGIGDKNITFTERIFGQRQSIASIVSNETPRVQASPETSLREEQLLLQVAQLTKKLARASKLPSYMGGLSSVAAGDEDTDIVDVDNTFTSIAKSEEISSANSSEVTDTVFMGDLNITNPLAKKLESFETECSPTTHIVNEKIEFSASTLVEPNPGV